MPQHQRIRHDVGMALSTTFVQMVAPCLQPSEQKELFSMAYEAIIAALTKYDEMMTDRQDSRVLRVKPSAN